MLWAIGLGAAAGVLAVPFAAHFVIYRVTGTCLLVAGAALLMMANSRHMDRDETRASGVLGMWIVIALFFLGIGLIWDFDTILDNAFGLTNLRFSYGMWTTMVWIVITGGPSMYFLRLLRTDPTRLPGMVGLTIAGAVFTLFMINTITGMFFVPRGAWNQSNASMRSGFWIGAMGLLAIGCLFGAQRPLVRPWRWIGVLCAAGAVAMALSGIWREISSKPGEKITISLISVAGVVCYANLLLLLSVRARQRWLVYSTIALAVVTTSLVNVIIILEQKFGGDSLLERAVIAGIILTASGTLAVAVLARLHRPVPIGRSAEEIREITCICPQCRRKQEIATGRPAACSQCGLRIEIRVEMPV